MVKIKKVASMPRRKHRRSVTIGSTRMSYDRLLKILDQTVLKSGAGTAVVKQRHQDHPDLFQSLLSSSESFERLLDFLRSEDTSRVKLEACLNFAILKGNVRMVDLLLKHVDLGNVQLTEAAYRSILGQVQTRKEMLRLLVDHGLDTGFYNDRGENLLHMFVHHFTKEHHGDVLETASVLLEADPDMLNELDLDDFTPLTRAVRNSDYELTAFFLDQGAEPGPLSLFVATQNKDAAIVELLLEKGARVDQDPEYSCLHEACENHDERILGLLVGSGCRVSYVSHGSTPFSLLDPEEANYDQCVVVLVREFAKLAFVGVPICPTDENLVQVRQAAREHYEKCLQELEVMDRTKFYSSHTYYSILVRSLGVKKLSKLAHNHELVARFEEFSRTIRYFASDLRRLFDEAVEVRDKELRVQHCVHSIFGHVLPKLVVRKVSENLTVEDLTLTI